MLFELELDLRVCREEDLVPLEWLGLYTPHRGIIAETFASQSRGEALMLLAMANNFPLAQAWLDFARRGSRARPRVWAVRVFPPLQRAGIGTWLIGAVERVAKAQGATSVEIGVEMNNPKARRFYECLGYRLRGTERAIVPYQCDPIDQHLLTKEL
jgi:GNAT superfamily N-acetyltransferase